MKRILFTCLFALSFAKDVTLDETLHHYLHSMDWLSTNASYEQKMAEIDQSFLALFPTYKFSGMFGSEYRKTAADPRYKNKVLSLNITESFHFGKDYYNWQSKEAERAVEKIKRITAREQIVISGVVLHINGALIQDKLNLITKRKKIANRNRAQIKIKYKMGLMSYSEKEKLYEKLDEYDLEEFNLKGEYANLISGYETQTGEDITGFKFPSLAKFDKHLPKNEKAFSAAAIAADSSVKIAKSEFDAAQLALKSAKSQLYPKIEFAANTIQELNLSGTPGKNSTDNLTVTVTHDLFASGNDLYALKINHSRAQLSRIQFMQAERNLRSDLHNMWVQYYSSKMAYQFAMKKLNRMTRVVKYDLKEFDVGRISIKELLDSQEKQTKAEQDMIEAQMKYRAQQLSILQTTNKLDEALGVKINGVQYE